MSDPRWDALADILVNYSTQVRPGENAQIVGEETDLRFSTRGGIYLDDRKILENGKYLV